MSKIEIPADKKRISLTRDRRNVYGECPTSSRKNIARGKQRQHRDERRAINQVLGQLQGEVDEDAASIAELEVKLTTADSRNRGFKKIPDQPLGNVIASKKSHRKEKERRANATV